MIKLILGTNICYTLLCLEFACFTEAGLSSGQPRLDSFFPPVNHCSILLLSAQSTMLGIVPQSVSVSTMSRCRDASKRFLVQVYFRVRLNILDNYYLEPTTRSDHKMRNTSPTTFRFLIQQSIRPLANIIALRGLKFISQNTTKYQQARPVPSVPRAENVWSVCGWRLPQGRVSVPEATRRDERTLKRPKATYLHYLSVCLLPASFDTQAGSQVGPYYTLRVRYLPDSREAKRKVRQDDDLLPQTSVPSSVPTSRLTTKFCCRLNQNKSHKTVSVTETFHVSQGRPGSCSSGGRLMDTWVHAMTWLLEGVTGEKMRSVCRSDFRPHGGYVRLIALVPPVHMVTHLRIPALRDASTGESDSCRQAQPAVGIHTWSTAIHRSAGWFTWSRLYTGNDESDIW
ncbi:hypothetical protein QBC37DRAFT_398029 [Rhypophila decipiens]|uniref:Uncharacterized protein n=1 Tax=Rhypophila decipiens TaxID=261697 RepID=A0AAN6YBR1_9PEZI|nr:hypothetical protein QBC37DRAFT_398029 [Rhypophila decipiens]